MISFKTIMTLLIIFSGIKSCASFDSLENVFWMVTQYSYIDLLRNPKITHSTFRRRPVGWAISCSCGAAVHCARNTIRTGRQLSFMTRWFGSGTQRCLHIVDA